MNANLILLQRKYSRVIEKFAERVNITLAEALDYFYRSELCRFIHEGVSDMHCMSDDYLAEELEMEYEGRYADN